MPYILLIDCLHTSPTNSRHCNLPHFVTCKAQKPTNHVEPDMKEENRKEKTIHHQENENIELQGGHVPFDPTGIKHIQKTPFSLKKTYVSPTQALYIPVYCLICVRTSSLYPWYFLWCNPRSSSPHEPKPYLQEYPPHLSWNTGASFDVVN